MFYRSLLKVTLITPEIESKHVETAKSEINFSELDVRAHVFGDCLDAESDNNDNQADKAINAHYWRGCWVPKERSIYSTQREKQPSLLFDTTIMSRGAHFLSLGLMLLLLQLLSMMFHHKRLRILLLLKEDYYSVMTNNNSTAKRNEEHTDFTKNQQQEQQRSLVHLHIGKNGGTSLDGLGKRLADETNRRYMGYTHFDWSYIHNLANKDVITMLRHPVTRAVSHIYSARNWMKQVQLKNTMTLGEYLNDTNLLLETRTCWFDGQGGVSWLTGTHEESSWVKRTKDEVEIANGEALDKNATAMCLLAADRLDQTLWFGILEDLPRSMQLLQYALNLSQVPSLPKGNVNPQQHRKKPTLWEQEALASLMPRDLWLYEYAKRLFEARYRAMKTGEFVQPNRLPLPNTWSCTSTPKHLECCEGPLKGSYRLRRYSVLRKRVNTTNSTTKVAVT